MERRGRMIMLHRSMRAMRQMVQSSRVRVFLHILLTRPHRRNAARKASNGDLNCTTRDIRVSRSLYLWDRSPRQAADGLVIPFG